jgi:hypothetical protein
MAIDDIQKQKLNNMCMSATDSTLGDELQRVGTAVDSMASSTITVASITDITNTPVKNLLKSNGTALSGTDQSAIKTIINAGSPYTLPAATTSVIGGVKEAATQSNSVASDVATLVTDFNALLAKLKSAGLMA